MELTLQIISNDQTLRSDTVRDLKGFSSQSIATQLKKGEQLVSMIPALKKVFDKMGDVIVNLSPETES